MSIAMLRAVRGNDSTDGPEPGQLLCDRYRVVKRIARGGSAMVLRAHDELLDVTVALKVLSEDTAGVMQLQKEAQAAMRLSHPSIVRVYNYERHRPWSLLVMEFVDGPNLSQQLAALPGHRYDAAQTVRLGLDCLDALVYAHGEGIIHNDLKPSNLLSAGGAPKLCDFGLAFPRPEAGVMGTPAYMSPERIRGAPGDARSDLYSLAATLYTVGNGQPMFSGNDTSQMRAHLRLPPPPSPHLPRALHEILRRAAAKEPEQRFQSAMEMRDAFEGIAHELGVPLPEHDSRRNRLRNSEEADDYPEITVEYDAPGNGMRAIEGRQLTSLWGGHFAVPSFWLDALPVTNQQYAAFVQATGAPAPSHWRCAEPPKHELQQPVTWVSLDEARAYAAWRRCRLPTQLEWESAARGPHGWRFPWGDEWSDERCHGRQRGLTGPADVGTLPAGASAEGCLDLVGNVWEWTEPDDLPGAPPPEQTWVYGGSYRDPCQRDGSFPRTQVASGKRYAHLGFRCARDREGL